MGVTVLSQLLPAALLVAAVAWLVHDQRKPDSLLRQLEHELRARLPVFSAETVRGKEAEFIRERLPHKVPRLLLTLLGGLVVVVTVAWWLTR